MLNEIKSHFSGKKILFLFLIMTASLFGQSWNSIVTTTIYDPNLIQLENLTNRDGIHIVVQNSNSTNSIKYYKLNSSGTVQTTTTIESQGGAEFPSIAGDNDHLYISYRLGNNVVTKKYNYSTSTWDAQNSISLHNNDCDRVDNAYDWRGLHIVYSEGGSTYETHYWLYASSAPTKHKIVSDQSNYIGSYPTITLSSNKAHVGFNSSGEAKTRDKNLSTDLWANTQSVAVSVAEKVHNGCDKLFDFYYVIVPGLQFNFYVKERAINGTSWSSPQLLNYDASGFIESMVTTTVTSDGNTHILYDTEQLTHRSYNCSSNSWSSEYEINSYPGLTQSSSLSSASNDLYIVYREYAGLSYYIKYCQYDAIPLAPQDLTVQIYTQGNDTYPKLTWSLNNEPDVFIKASAYEIWRRTKCWSQEWSPWSLKGYKNGNQSEYIEYTISGLYAEACTAEYKIRAKDNTNNYSPYSSTVSINFSQFNNFSLFNKLSQGVVKNEYDLSQNYPNPFNPSTQISYSLAQDAFVTLKVYDMLGNEVAELVNSGQTAGVHNINFDASELSSGIYIYRVIAMNGERILHSDSKRMLLLK